MFLNNLFSLSYAKKPLLKFSFQEPDEEVLLLLRAHPITQTPWIVTSFFFLAVPLFFSGLISHLPLSENQILILIIFWYAFCLSFILHNFYFWYFNLGLVTSVRIIDIDCYNLLNTESTSTLIEKIEELQKKTLGIFGTWFDYGTVFIQTAGEKPNVEFTNIPKPAQVVRIINELMEGPHVH
jgi:hypothetical protein